MKTIIFIAVLALGTQALAAPAPLADWAVVGQKVQEVSDSIQRAFRDVVSFSRNENATVGASVEAKLNLYVEKIVQPIVVAPVQAKVLAQSLVEEEARIFKEAARSVVVLSSAVIVDELRQLSNVSKAVISARLLLGVGQIDVIGQELIAALQ